MAAAGVARPASASDDGYQNVFTSVLTAVGVMSPDNTPEIEYRERPPLVLPPGSQLAKPQAAGAVRSAAWPNDPDVLRRKKAADDAKAPMSSAFNHSDDQRMSKDEQLKYRATQDTAVAISPTQCPLNEKSMVRCRNPEAFKAEEDRLKASHPEKSEKLEAGVEPDRLYLTQPPKGYLKASKVIEATHEAPQPKRDDSSPLSTYIHPDVHKDDPLE